MDNFNIWETIFVIIVPAMIASAPAIFGAIKAKQMTKVEKTNVDAVAAKSISEAYDIMTETMQNRMAKLEDNQQKMEVKLEKQGKRIRYLEHGVYILIDQVKSLGAEPAFILTEEEN